MMMMRRRRRKRTDAVRCLSCQRWVCFVSRDEQAIQRRLTRLLRRRMLSEGGSLSGLPSRSCPDCDSGCRPSWLRAGPPESLPPSLPPSPKDGHGEGAKATAR
eukprot:3467611-Rhodomonas_salina.2